MKVTDQRNGQADLLEPLPNRGHGRRCLARVDGDPHELGTGTGKRPDLLNRPLDIRSVRVRHGLDYDRSIATHADRAD